MVTECAATILQVSNLNAALSFYTDVLGFTKDFEYGSVAGLHHGNVFIHLSGPAAYGNKQAVGEGHMYIFCDEVDQYYQDITAKGADTFVPRQIVYTVSGISPSEIWTGTSLHLGKASTKRKVPKGSPLNKDKPPKNAAIKIAMSGILHPARNQPGVPIMWSATRA